MSKSIGALALLLGVLAGCGGGGDANAGAPPVTAAAGLEEDDAAMTSAAKPAPVPAAPRIDSTLIPAPGEALQRETYSYTGGGRDPFLSVLENAGLGPELVDLDLVVVIVDKRDASASVAVLRDRITNKSYTLREGERIGRARVADIRERDVTFTVDDYGTAREVTLSIRKREDMTP